MRGLSIAAALVATALAAPGGAAHAQGRTDGYGQGPTYDGFLCCNMRSTGKWISDINYVDDAPITVPLGTPVRVVGYGANRVFTEIGGRRHALGNDYSRTMPLAEFALRYVVTTDPQLRLASFDPDVRSAIVSGRVRTGMTREQVVMAIGYPITSENPKLDAPAWRYWRSMSDEFHVLWSPEGRVAEFIGNAVTKRTLFEP